MKIVSHLNNEFGYLYFAHSGPVAIRPSLTTISTDNRYFTIPMLHIGLRDSCVAGFSNGVIWSPFVVPGRI